MEASNALQTGLEKLRQGQVDEAIQLFQAAVQAEPGNPQAHAYLGVAHCQKKDFTSAIQELNEARSLDPSSASIAFNLGVAHHSSGGLAQARACYEAALRLDPSYQKAKAALEQIAARQAPPAQIPAPQEAPAATTAFPGDAVITECPLCKSPSAPGDTRCGVCGADFTPILKKFVVRETMVTGQQVLVCASCKAIVPDIRVPHCPNCGLDFKTGVRMREAPMVNPSGQPLTHIRPGEAIAHGQSWEYASFWRRLAGFVIDSIILFVVGGILTWPLLMGPLFDMVRQMQQMAPTAPRTQSAHLELAQFPGPATPGMPGAPGMPGTSGQQGFPGYPNMPMSPELILKFYSGAVKATALMLLLNAVYYTLLVGLVGQSLGMMAVRVRYLRSDGTGVGVPRAFLRWLVSKSVAIILFLVGVSGPRSSLERTLWLPLYMLVLVGYLWMLWDQRNQTLYDKAVDTIVVVG